MYLAYTGNVQIPSHRYSTDAIEVGLVLNNALPLIEKKRALRLFLDRQVSRWQKYPGEADFLAYDIAGLLATNFVRQLPKDDPYLAVLFLAGDLELPEDHRLVGSSWPALVQLIAALPNE
ncbi:MAG TPA: hypothetical protein VH599_07420 [Ktedonobacterales bacterium]